MQPVKGGNFWGLEGRKGDKGRGTEITCRELSHPTHTGTPLHLEGLDKSPQQDADGVALAEQFNEPCSSEETQEAEVDEVVLQRKRIAL